MKRALLLNSGYEPLRFISDERAITLVYSERVEIVEIDGRPSLWDETFSSPSTTIRVPATLRLLKRVYKRWRRPKFRKKVLFNRDSWQCQYCAKELNWGNITIEHVIPSSLGGDTSWTNCVAACKPCNLKKGQRTPAQAGMKLLKHPIEPSPLHFWDTAKTTIWHDDWNIFLKKE